MTRKEEVIEAVKWCGYEYHLSEENENCIIVDYPGVKADPNELFDTAEHTSINRRVPKISGNAIRFLDFDENYMYLSMNFFGVKPSKIYMKELLKFYLDNPNLF